MLSEAADGLYSRAIIQSAPLGMREGRDEMTAAMRAAAAESLGDTDPFAAGVDELHRAQVAAVVAAQRFGLVSGMAFGPLLGVDPLPAAGEVSARIARVARTVDLLVGCTRLDAAPFVEISPRASRLRALGPFAKPAARVASATMTRQIFDGPARRFADRWRSEGVAHRCTGSTGRLETRRWAPATAWICRCCWVRGPRGRARRCWAPTQIRWITNLPCGCAGCGVASPTTVSTAWAPSGCG